VFINLLAFGVTLNGEHALSSLCFKRSVETADACEEINKLERLFVHDMELTVYL